VLVYFAIVSMTGMIRVALPISLRDIEHGANVAGVSGLAFTLGGLGAAFSVFVLGTRFFRSGQMRSGLVVFSLLTGAAQLLLAASHNVPSFVAVFALISLLQAAMIPATNTLIAANAPRSRRGTAFGLASSAQAIAFIAGPSSAAFFTAISLQLGFAVLGAISVALALVLLVWLREPPLAVFVASGSAGTFDEPSGDAVAAVRSPS
jgi:MFS family permease